MWRGDFPRVRETFPPALRVPWRPPSFAPGGVSSARLPAQGPVWRPGPWLGMSARTEAFRQGLRELGYVEGTTILIEWRSAEGQLERLPSLAAELVRLKVDVIVTAGPSATRPAKAATVTIPIVITNDNDPVANGFVASLARPGGNITGLSTLSPEYTENNSSFSRRSFRSSRAWRSWGRRPSLATLKRYERRNARPGPSACSFNTWT